MAADLQGSPEAPISKLISDQAQTIAIAASQQNWDPVAIYEWVKNNVETEWYFGAMKGAEETLRQKSGNDADQAALLVALFRASGYPARYVRGVVEFFPGLGAIKSLTGIEDPAAIGEFFRKAGIPFEPVMDGLEIINYRVEHVWVEALIPYANYRGAMADSQGKIWLPLDTSFKVAGYDESGSIDLYGAPGNPLDALRDAYLAASQLQTPLEYVRQETENFLAATVPGTTYPELLHSRNLRSENLAILPSAPQFTEISITGEYASLPSALIHTAHFQANSPAPESLPLFDFSLPVYKLSNQQVVIGFEPETVEDQEIINIWGGLENTPAYLVRLRPVLTVNDERIVVGKDGIAVGGDLELKVELVSPAGNVAFNNTLVAGYPAIIGVVAQDAVLPDSANIDIEVTDLLYREALNYVDRWNQGESELARLFNLRRLRPIPTVVTLGAALEVVELLGVPQGVAWKGLFLDADLRSVESVRRSQVADDRQKMFMQLSALEGSVLESRIFEDAFQVESVSTARLLGLASDSLVPILTIDAANVDTVVPTLPFADNVKADITTAVVQGMTVQIPEQAVSLQDWSGIGYLKEDPVTGAAGYMLSGQIAGGMTVVSPSSWAYEWVAAFESPFAALRNLNPLAAHSVHKLGGTDFQVGAAGTQLNEPLAVLVRDAEGRPVAGAPVVFEIQRGGGVFANGEQTIAATTDLRGIARTSSKLKLGSNILVEATTYSRDGDQFASFARENTVTARLENNVELVQAFVAIAIPGTPMQLVPFGNQIAGSILQYAGEIGVKVLDQYSNPVANVPILFAAGTPASWHSWCTVESANQTMLQAQVTGDDACSKTLPSWGECAVTGSDTAVTWSNGVVSAGIVMGSYPDGKYPITVSYAGTGAVTLPPAYFTGYTNAAAPDSTCGESVPPSSFLSLHSEDTLYRVRPAGPLVKVRAKAEMIAEGTAAQPGAENLTCGGETLSCNQNAGDGAFAFVEPDSLSVSFNGAMGTLNTTVSDMYEGDVTLAVGSNSVVVRASASDTVSRYVNSCSGCATQQTDQTKTVPLDWSIDYIGAALDMPDAITVELNQYGFPVADVPVSYSILPLDYDAVSASFLIYQGVDLVYVMSADTMGANTDIIPSNLHFDPARQYFVQVVLNHGWNEAEVWSEKVPINTKLVDLDIDSDNNAGMNEDGTHRLPARDPLEELVEAQSQSPGKVIFTNRLDVDRDKVPGFADGIDMFGNQGDGASAPFVPLLLEIDGTLDPTQVRVKFTYDASNPALITRSGDQAAGYVYAPAPGSLRLWSKDGGVSRKVAGLAEDGNYIAPNTSYTLEQLGASIAPHLWQVYVEGIADAGEAQSIWLDVETAAGGVTTNVGADTVKVSIVNAALVPDYDHSRVIDQSDIDRAGRGDTYYFWINDDDDEGETEGSDIPGVKQSASIFLDNENNIVDGVRDLIDFFPVTLDIAGLVRTFPPASYTYRLISNAENLRVVFTELTNVNAGDYLTVVDTARQLGMAASRKVRAGGIEALSAAEESLFTTVVQATTPASAPVVLIEGVLPGTEPLQLTVTNALGEVVARVELKLSLDGVEQMYRRKSLIGELKNFYQVNSGQQSVFASESVPDIDQPDRLFIDDFENKGHFAGFDAENEQNNNLIHVHGYNVNDQDARGEQAEIFKRFYWSGSKVKFWGITWFGWDSQWPIVERSPNYHVNVRHAFNTGRLLKEFVAAQGLDEATIFGHSLGNMVISSAIREGMTIGRYLMVNPAVAEEAYTPRDVYEGGVDYAVGTPWRTATKESMYHPAWRYPEEQPVELEQGYRPFLWASEWYKVFDSGDGRASLTWRDIFAQVRANTGTYVYYTPTDEAFRPFNYTLELAVNDPAGTNYQTNVNDWPGWEDIVQNYSLTNRSKLGTYSWSIQELFKGRFPTIVDPDSDAGGWGFNYVLSDGYYQCDEPSLPEEIPNCMMIAPATANALEPNVLRTRPLFSKNADHEPLGLYSDSLFSVFDTLPEELLREELLANEISALTFAAGHRGVKEIRTLDEDRDIDIRQTFAIRKPWPDNRLEGYDWRHSDIYVVAYSYLFSLYDGWKSLINGE
ncbi:transglutaminase domain-containing protein [Trichloromonas sp.]|uniref:transglutaminase domain-containing protein n=1 Tax=Trichloromonas sp. TaxID=3069249 RepID=UPI003D81849C